MENSTTMEDQAITYTDNDGHQISDINILAKLCDEAGDVSPDIRNCLMAYSLNTSTKQLESVYKLFLKPVIV